MIFQNIEFHNVERLEPCEKGFSMLRIPREVGEKLSDRARDEVSRYCTGVELRFCIKGEAAEVTLRADDNEEALTGYVYYGSFQGGWQHSSFTIGQENTTITVPRPEGLSILREIANEQGLGFDPEAVRVILPYGTCYFVEARGELEPPDSSLLPKKTYLAYGSSITHGSLALGAPHTYPFRIAQMARCDYLNLGFAGTAHLEKEMAEYLVSRKDWDFASVEMGINMIGEIFSEELFEERVREFVNILAEDPRPVFATSLFGFLGQDQKKGKRYREIVRGCAGEKLLFTDGLELLDNPAYISQDLTHPSLEGIERIAREWYKKMKRVL